MIDKKSPLFLLVLLILWCIPLIGQEVTPLDDSDSDVIEYPRQSVGITGKRRFGSSLNYAYEPNANFKIFTSLGINYLHTAPPLFYTIDLKGTYIGAGCSYLLNKFDMPYLGLLRNKRGEGSGLFQVVQIGFFADLLAGNCSYSMNKTIFNPQYEDYNITLERKNAKYLNVSSGISFNINIHNKFSFVFIPVEISRPIGLTETFLGKQIMPFENNSNILFYNYGATLNYYIR